MACAECSARIAELTALLSALADLPEPEMPASVVVRLDAAIERAWQERESDPEFADEVRVPARRREPRSTWNKWRRLAVPASALAVIAGAFVGFGYLVSHSSTSSSSSTSASGAAPHAAAGRGANTDAALSAMARRALAGTAVFNSAERGASAEAGRATPRASASAHPLAPCFHAPPKPGYAVAAAAAETYAGADASLVVYRNDEEPASTTTFYAVLYAGSCPNATSVVLDQGLVSADR